MKEGTKPIRSQLIDTAWALAEGWPRSDLRVLWALLTRAEIRGPWTEPEFTLLNKFVESGNTVIDVGANVGKYTLMMSRLVGSAGHVFAYEPFSESYARLNRLVRLTSSSNVAPRPYAVWDKSMTVRLNLKRVRWGSIEDGYTYALDSKGAIEVPAVTIDDEVTRWHMQRLTFIKCDVEGAEIKVLKGARETILRFRPVLLCEVWAEWCRRYGQNVDAIFDLTRGMDYDSFFVREGRLERADGPSADRTNYFFLPR